MQMHFRVDVFDFGEQTLRHRKDYIGIFGGNDHPQPVLALAVALGLGISDQNRHKCWKVFSAVKLQGIDQQSVADEQSLCNCIIAQNVRIFLIVYPVECAVWTLASQCVPDKALGFFMVESGCQQDHPPHCCNIAAPRQFPGFASFLPSP